MPTSGFNLASIIGNLWVESDSEVQKRLLFYLFARDVGDSLQEAIATDLKDREQLQAAWKEFENNDSEATWTNMLKCAKPLGFYFSFLDHVDQLPNEEFADPVSPTEPVYFGESVLRRRWSLKQIDNPIHRLMHLDTMEEGRPYGIDPDTNAIVGADRLIADYELVLAWLKHLLRDLGHSDSSEPLTTVVAVPATMSNTAGAVLTKVLLDAGFAGVVLKPQNDLVAARTFSTDDINPVVVNISTLVTDISFEPSNGKAPFSYRVESLGEEVDREIEKRIQAAIRAEEPENHAVSFNTISEDRLFFWKDAYRSKLWQRLLDSSDYYGEFQFPYKLDDSPTFRDVRPILTEDLLRDCLTAKLEEPLKDALTQICQLTEGNIPPVLLSGSGSATTGLIDWTKAVIKSVCPSSTADVRNVESPIDCTVDGAFSLGKSIDSEQWSKITSLQAECSKYSISEGQLPQFLEHWNNLVSQPENAKTLMH